MKEPAGTRGLRRHAPRGRRTGSLGLWSRMRRASRLIVWVLVVLLGGSMVAYFALALPSLGGAR